MYCSKEAIPIYISRALSLRNLVLVYECGRVFPAGVGLDPPSKDATNWLSSRFGRSVEKRQRSGRLRIVFTRCASFMPQLGPPQEVIICERQGALCGKPGKVQQHAQAYRDTIYRVSKHPIRRGQTEARSTTILESADTLCPIIKDANREVF